MQFDHLKRRDFITLVSGMAAAWPFAVRAQQQAIPTIGFLSSLRSTDQAHIFAAFHQGLNEGGYVEGRNVALEYRWAAGDYARLPELAAELVSARVALIAAVSGTPSASAAKSATATIPIVFAMGSDPVQFGLVTSLNRPGGHVTGATFFNAGLGAKRLELLRELVPAITKVAVLVNPNNPPSVVDKSKVQAAADTMGLQAKVLNVVSSRDIEIVFSIGIREHGDALYVGPDPVFLNERHLLSELTARHGIPAVYADREQAEAGGLMSYGTSRTDAYRQAGHYAARILNGEKPGDLPVLLPTKFEMLINLKTAKALGLTVPPMLLARADEVIE
jgi:putative ABC transport system substrate-binding protein